jgi:hypothetical protein
LARTAWGMSAREAFYEVPEWELGVLLSEWHRQQEEADKPRREAELAEKAKAARGEV